MDRCKGQVAVEFLMYAGLFMIIAIAAYVLISFTERGEVSLRESQLITAFGYKFASAPTICFKGGEGFSYDIGFAKEIDGRPYNITYICKETSSEPRTCQAQVAWEGSYQEFIYPYIIAPAHYIKGTNYTYGQSSCLVPGSASGGITYVYMGSENQFNKGHLIFKNVGIAPGDEYPTIELYCEVN